MPTTNRQQLLELAVQFWIEAAHEHNHDKPSQCGACWKSYMASELWRHVTNFEIPVNYPQVHQASQFRLLNLERAKLYNAA